MEITKSYSSDNLNPNWNADTALRIFVMGDCIYDSQLKRHRHLRGEERIDDLVNEIQRMVDENETKIKTREEKTKSDDVQ